MTQVKTEEHPEYKSDTDNPFGSGEFPPVEVNINDCYLISSGDFETWRDAENELIRQAKCALYRRMRKQGCEEITSPQMTTNFLELELGAEEQEIFCALWLDTRHRVIEFQRMFYGTIDGASVHPREVVKAALKCNAAAVIFAHNHPSGKAEPSQADITITTRLKSALALVDVRTLDHIVIGSHGDTVSLAQRGHL